MSRDEIVSLTCMPISKPAGVREAFLISLFSQTLKSLFQLDSAQVECRVFQEVSEFALHLSIVYCARRLVASNLLAL